MGAPFAKKLVRARKRAHLTQAQAAKLVGVIPNTFARWERGERIPPSEAEILTRERILRILRPPPKALREA
jgi:transcriptional regulator with XRE-family HTH domain